MTAQLQLRERATLLADLRQIVQAMKNLALAELQRLQRSQPALAEAQTTLEAAWLELADPTARPEGGGAEDRIWLVIGAERGFCGAFNAHLADAVSTLQALPGQTLWLAGQRLADAWLANRPAGTGQNPPRVLPGCGALDEAEPALAAWLQAATEAVAGATAPQGGPRPAVWLLSTGPAGLRAQRLLPSPGAPQPWSDAGAAAPTAMSVSWASSPPPRQAPIRLGLPRPVLMAAVLHQTVRVQLRAALETSLVQENHARLAQMQRAQDHLDELAAELRRRWARLRQADITNELELLTAALGPDAIPGRG
ncbi:F0F1 ATP synthase subunit gamma [Ideonella sp. B508-1]|uniref:F0F1 ATP synthase subunit gamma n=1 Tax=Ideonella sp. B508-1 TaxID=137716 RepID=UPI000349B882|nr:F0F1 ATP synthase subunit gamma [Ideonella sp. B508-1]